MATTKSRSPLVLHTIVLHAPYVRTQLDAYRYVRAHFPAQTIDDILGKDNAGKAFRVLIRPSVLFTNTAYVSKKINDHLTLVFGKKLG